MSKQKNSNYKHKPHQSFPALERAVATGHWDEAETLARKALALLPRAPFPLKALGASLLQQGRELEAIQSLQQALAVNPHDAELYNNLGIACLFAAQWEASIEYFQQALARKPKDYVIWKNIGRAYTRLRKPREAVETLARAIELHPDNYIEALHLLAVALAEGGQLEQSLNIFKELWKNGESTKSILSQLVFTSLKIGSWDLIAQWLSDFRATPDHSGIHASDPLASLAFPGTTWDEHFRIASGHAMLSAPQHCIQSAPAPVFRIESSNRKLRIGYFSGDFRKHAVGFLIPQIIELHDRSRFEVCGYAVGDDDQSDIRKRIAAAFDRFTDLGQLACRDAFKTLRAGELDVVINLQGWTNDFASEFFAERVAPIQISWLGYPGTMGHPVFADYLIGDRIVTPLEKSDYFSETLALLDCCYLPMDTSCPPPTRLSRSAAGLPEAPFVFCSLNNRYKFNPPLLDLWSNILRQCPEAIIWLSSAAPEANQNLLKEFERRGIAPARVLFAPRVPTQAEHRQRITAADLALDTMPYNSHSSGLDTLWAGVPIISLLGETFANRVGASLLHHTDLDELIVHTTEAYCQKAIALYNDRERLNDLRQRLENGRTSAVLWNTKKLTQSLEEIYETAWHNGKNGIKRPITLS